MIYEDVQGAFEHREKVHIVEHRRFESDMRRHFVGEVRFYDANHLRVKGHLFVFDHGRGEFIKVPPERTRVFSIDNRISITVLPKDFDLTTAAYKRNGPDMVFTDGKVTGLDIGAFSSHG